MSSGWLSCEKECATDGDVLEHRVEWVGLILSFCVMVGVGGGYPSFGKVFEEIEELGAEAARVLWSCRSVVVEGAADGNYPGA